MRVRSSGAPPNVTANISNEEHSSSAACWYAGKTALPALLGRGANLAGSSGYWVATPVSASQWSFCRTGSRTFAVRLPGITKRGGSPPLFNVFEAGSVRLQITPGCSGPRRRSFPLEGEAGRRCGLRHPGHFLRVHSFFEFQQGGAATRPVWNL